MIEEANNEIEMYLHCKQCLTQKPLGVSMAEWGTYDVGWTRLGIQVWCKKHNSNILHMDFQGQKHPAITYCKPIKRRRNGKEKEN